MVLSDLVDERDKNIKLYGLKDVDMNAVTVIFGHIDGAYSYCWIEGQPDKVVHLSVGTPIEPFEDGYKVS